MNGEQPSEHMPAAAPPAVSPETALKEREIAIKAREVNLTARFQALSFVSAVLGACLAFFGTAWGNWHQATENRELEKVKAQENKDLEQQKLTNDLAIERQKLEGNLILTFLADKDEEKRKKNLLFLQRAEYIHLPEDLVEDIKSDKQAVPQVDAIRDFGPPEGSAQPGTPRADFNRLRNRPKPPDATDFDSSVDLQRLLDASDKGALDQMRAATIEGYVLAVKRGGITTANMASAAPARQDVIIVVAPSMQSGPSEQVVCAVTARFRAQHDDWSLNRLKADLVGKQCKISGWLLFNSEHFLQSANNPHHGLRVWRGTAWELHPVTAIEVTN